MPGRFLQPACWIFLLALLAPPGFAQDDWEDDWGDEAAQPVELHGFIESSGALRFLDDAAQPGDFLLGEARFRLDLSYYSDRADLAFKGDVVADGITRRTEADIRQASVLLRVRTWLDVQAGRQVLTWGSGDLVFLNDLFPKDFVSFFIGRADEFLKAPSNAVRALLNASVVNLDLVWSPIFEPDRYITGERLSFFDPLTARRVGLNTLAAPFEAALPDQTLGNGELAARAYRSLGGYEVSAYGYLGFTKQPRAFNPATGRATFAPLGVYGASLRGAFAGGLINLEGAYYDALDDRDGTNPTLPNGQIRLLAGHERELIPSLTLGLQYYLEWTQDYDALLANSFTPRYEPEEFRHLITGRFTYRLMQETLTLSLFGFVAPVDGDVHLRPALSRQWSDAVTLSTGLNLMVGPTPSFFGQFEENSNAYLRIRFGF